MASALTYYATLLRRAGDLGLRNVRRAPWPRIARWAGLAVAVLVIAPLLVLALADWNAMRGPIARAASGLLGRDVTIAGDLDVHPWSWEPLIVADGIRVANPAWAGAGDTIAVRRVSVRVAWSALLIGRIRVTSLELDGPQFNFLRETSGRATWSFGRDTASRQPLNIPPIRAFALRDGTLKIVDDKRDLVLEAQIASDDTAGKATPFRLSGEGRINGDAFQLSFTGASLVKIARDRPYPFHAEVRAGPTHVIADGAIDRPFDLSRYTARISGEGADLADLYRLIGLALPNTPPYALKMLLRRERTRYLLSEITGTVGDTDLSGTITVNSAGARKFVDADLSSRALDFDDLAVVLGGAPNTARGETASPAQRAMAQKLAQADRLLPDARLDLDRVRSLDAKLRYRARAVRTEWLPLRSFALDMTLDHGVLTGDPVSFSLPRGEIVATARIDATADTPVVDVDLRMTNARVEDFLAKSGQPDAFTGALQARAKLRGRGRSIHEAASTADGQVSVVVPQGEIRGAFAELLGINVTRGLGLLLSGDTEKTDVRCAVADFQGRNGVLTARTVVIDTGVVLATGGGTVNLGTEALDLKLEGTPKQPRLIRLMAPVNITGHLRSPKAGVDLAKAGTQTGIAAALATLLTPVAVILPFVSAGLAEDANCAALMRTAQRR